MYIVKLKYIIFLFFLLKINISCNNQESKTKNDSSYNINPQIQETEYIYIKDNYFNYKGNRFFPIMLNYIINFREINGELVITPFYGYKDNVCCEIKIKDSILNTLEGHLKLIKELGFNSIRLIGIDKISIDENPKLPYQKICNIYQDSLEIKNNYDIIFDCISDFINIAENLELKIMLLLKGPVQNKILEDFTKELLLRFNNNPTIWSYDFKNEPLYFDTIYSNVDIYNWQKNDVFKKLSKWKKMILNYAPNQLFTIGFAEPIEVFKWDPSILPVDFVAFHTYHPLRIPNEIYWYSKYVNKPWMIGETSLPADNDSISYFEQVLFLKDIYRYVVNCGGAGLGWWGFQDVNWGGFEHDFTSIMNRQGFTKTKDNKHIIKGSLKPVAFEFSKLNEYKPTYDCICMTNYKNMLGYSNYVVSGKILNIRSLEPIEGAVIRGWDKNWEIAANTYSDSLGKFKLYSNIKFENFRISAPGMNSINISEKIEYKLSENKHNNYKNIKMKNEKLEYHQISYQHFLADKSILYDKNIDINDNRYFIFNFDESLFNQAIYKGNLQTVALDIASIETPRLADKIESLWYLIRYELKSSFSE